MKTKATAREVMEQAGKYGWQDGDSYPVNVVEALGEVAELLGIKEGPLLMLSSHNAYRLEGEVTKPENLDKEVELEWFIVGKVIPD